MRMKIKPATANGVSCLTQSDALARFARFHPGVVAVGVLLALAVAVAMMRLYRIGEVAPGLSYGESGYARSALDVLAGEHSVFYRGRGGGHEVLGVYAIALATSMLGRSLTAMHLPTALASSGTVFVVFFLGKYLFGWDEANGEPTRWRGVFVGGTGAGLLAISMGQTILGHTAFRANFLPLLLSLCLLLLWSGRRGKSWWRIVLAAVCAGLLPYTYIPARFVPLLLLLFGLTFLFPNRLFTWEKARGEAPWICVFVFVAGLVAMPILIFFAQNPDQFFNRSGKVWFFRDEQGSLLGIFLTNIWEHLLAFGFRGDQNEIYNFAGQPMLNPWEAVFFWLGVGMTIWGWKRQAVYRLLFLWLAVLLLPAFLAREGGAPNTIRMIGAVPAVYLLVGVGVWEAYRFFQTRFFRQDGKFAFAVGVLVSGTILIQGVSTFLTYTQRWATSQKTHREFHGEMVDAALMLNEQPNDADSVFLFPYSHWHWNFEYIYKGLPPDEHISLDYSSPRLKDHYKEVAPIIFLYTPDLTNKVESALASVDKASAVRVFDWDNNRIWGDGRDDYTVALVGKYGRYLESAKYRGFQVHTFTDLDPNRPWWSFKQVKSEVIHFDDGLSLQLLGLGQGPERLLTATAGTVELTLDRSLWLALLWQTAPNVDIDYKASLRIYAMPKGNKVYQEDVGLLKSDGSPTSRWSPGELVDTLHMVYFPADFPPGEYELQLVVYDSATGDPTAKLHTWEPELILASLRLSEAEW